MPERLKAYGGSLWWIIYLNAVKYISKNIREYPGVINFFKYVKISNEYFFQTILVNSKFKDSIVNIMPKFEILERRTDRHPAVLTKSDFDKIVQFDKVIVWKFNIQVDAKILDLIDYRILGTKNRISMDECNQVSVNHYNYPDLVI